MKLAQAGLAAVALVFGTTHGLAQDQGEVQRQLAELKARLQSQETELKAIRSENADMKARLDGTTAPAAASRLDTELNRLQEACDPRHCATNIRAFANPIHMGGEFRFRRGVSLGDNIIPDPDLIDGRFLQDEHDGDWSDARVRLNFCYNFGCDVTAFAELQAHWGFGDDPTGLVDEMNGTNTIGDVHMYQAWILLRNVFCRKELTTKGGRQEFVFGNQFHFGNADWYNGVVFDGLRADWNDRCWHLTLFTAKLATVDGDYNQIWSYRNSHDDDELWGAYFTTTALKNTVIDLYWFYVNGHGGASGENSLNSGANAGFGNNPELGFPGVLGYLYPGDTAYFHTVGARIAGNFNIACGLDYNLEAAYQFGDLHNLELDGTDLDIDALTVEGEVGLTFDRKHNFRVFARGLYAQGPEDDDHVGYLILYPNRHSNYGFRARYGLADMIPMTNVVALQAGAHFDPIRNWTFGATALWATTDEAVGVGLDDDYGVELDIWGEWRWTPNLTFGGGIAILDVEDQGEILWGVEGTQIIGYLQTRLIF